MIVPYEEALAWLRDSERGREMVALDVSKRTIGLAGADPSWSLATPLGSIRRTRLEADLKALQARVREREAGILVIGWPLNMDGSEGPRCQAIRAFAREVAAALALPVVLWDERLSTFAADELAPARGRRAPDRDALAAGAILQDLLDRLRRDA